jgi:radical SAM superfamily enzyme YgiQ (UPF0313 family)
MIYPEIPITYWSFTHALKYTRAKTSYPPLGLMTIAAMLPSEYAIKLVDMNVQPLSEKDIREADMIFISAMIVQKESFENVIHRVKKYNKTIVAGGPYPSSAYKTLYGVDHIIINECETTLLKFMEDFENGCAEREYRSDEYPDITTTPSPRFDLVDHRNYYSMMLQFSRGCPFSCEFCDIIEMFGRKPRTKTPDQFINEMNSLYETGFRGSLFIVDDNFIGNKANCRELLKQIIPWQRDRKFPFGLFTEASMNLADDDELITLMVDAGFNMVFAGIESPSIESLAEAHKTQNMRTDLSEGVRKMQQKGLEVTGGFIVGFDSDPDDIFERQFNFIQAAGIPVAMVGLLQAFPGTQLYERLKKEGRLTGETNGNNTHDLDLNFTSRMDETRLREGYKELITRLYNTENYYIRCKNLLKRLPVNDFHGRSVGLDDILILWKFTVKNMLSAGGRKHLKFILWTLLNNRKLFPDAVRLSIMGVHLIAITQDLIELEGFRTFLNSNVTMLNDALTRPTREREKTVAASLQRKTMFVKNEAVNRFKRLNANIKKSAKNYLVEFHVTIDELISNSQMNLKKKTGAY